MYLARTWGEPVKIRNETQVMQKRDDEPGSKDVDPRGVKEEMV